MMKIKIASSSMTTGDNAAVQSHSLAPESQRRAGG